MPTFYGPASGDSSAVAVRVSSTLRGRLASFDPILRKLCYGHHLRPNRPSMTAYLLGHPEE